MEAMRELSAYCDRSPDARAHAISLLNETPDLLCAEIDDSLAVQAGAFVVFYKPSDGMRRALVAIRARYGKSIDVA